MAKLTYKTQRTLNWRALNRKIMQTYEVDGDDAQRAVFGDGAENGKTVHGNTVRSATTRPVSARTIETERVDLSDILCDLCGRGELDAGEYTVQLFW